MISISTLRVVAKPPTIGGDKSITHHGIAIEPAGFHLSRVGGTTELDLQTAEEIVHRSNIYNELVTELERTVAQLRAGYSEDLKDSQVEILCPAFKSARELLNKTKNR